MDLGYILNPQGGHSVLTIMLIALILGILHGATPDEHTWPITFSYAVGSYSTKKGMKAGLAFSGGFTLQRALLTTLGFLGLATIYRQYDLNGPVYVVVGIAMAIAGAYILRRKIYLHLPFDVLLHGGSHHTEKAERLPLHETKMRDAPLSMATVHGLIAGFGFGAYATIITFILAPQVPSIWYAPLVGMFFGIGTTIMQIILGGIFASITRIKKLSEQKVSYIARKTAGRTLYYGGFMFSLIGIATILFPGLASAGIVTGSQIPNLDSIGIATLLVVLIVGGIGIGSLLLGFREMLRKGRDVG
ncbi:MAG: hypothetical protein KGH59_05080 [Candidatus Micrarchaeota archaeon]|nr:hypothetical protein [Candidatus Micrarchaeota archaeon]MDE1805123.1 hypothetical protein [Candidatus Micrarchaeota archaeon]